LTQYTKSKLSSTTAAVLHDNRNVTDRLVEHTPACTFGRHVPLAAHRADLVADS
jgi:hypothetical protein